MLSISNLKVQLPNNRCRPLRLPVKSFVGLEASRALNYNGYIQRQHPWHLQIPRPRVMDMIQNKLQVLQVRDKFWSTLKISTYPSCACLPEMPSNLPDTRESRPVETAVSVHSTVSNSSTMARVFTLTSIPSVEDFAFWCWWTRIPLHHSTDQEE